MVLQCNDNLHKRNIIFLRGVVILRSPTEIGYSYDLAPNSDPYFPVVQVEG